MKKLLKQLHCLLPFIPFTFFIIVLCTTSAMMSIESEENTIVYSPYLKLAVILSLVVCAGICSFQLWRYLKNAISKTDDTEDTLFEDLDNWCKSYPKDLAYYRTGIQLVNAKYRKHGIVYELVQNQKFDRLLRRKEHLGNQLNYLEGLNQCFLSLILSIIATLVMNTVDSNNWVIFFIVILFVIVTFIVITVAKFNENTFQLNQSERSIREYELKRLDDYIDEYNRQSVVLEEQEIVLHTQVTVIDALSKSLKSAKKNKRQEILDDIMCIKHLNLLDYDVANAHLEFFYIDGKKCCLVYKNEGFSNNDSPAHQQLINNDYSALYSKLERYSLFQHSNEKTAL